MAYISASDLYKQFYKKCIYVCTYILTNNTKMGKCVLGIYIILFK